MELREHSYLEANYAIILIIYSYIKSMTSEEFTTKLLQRLPTDNGIQLSVERNEDNIVFSHGNDSCGIPVPDGQPENIPE